jgi:hypothetical protein
MSVRETSSFVSSCGDLARDRHLRNDVAEMTERPEPPGGEVLSSLPSTRPQRRSARRASGGESGEAAKPRPAESKGAPKRASRAGAKASGRPRAKAKGRRPTAVRPSAATKAAGSQPRERPAQTPQGVELVGTAIQAAGELAQLGLQLSTRALAGAVRRIPRP